ncbi:MAG: copper amine oxidase N-terminal domain-containing protein [Firmicutes bacterium]|nr:copper amine oxidase N-terminal domain-containing protein [Bacillota bacterium]
MKNILHRIGLLLVLGIIATMFMGVGVASASDYIEVSTGWRFVEAGEDKQEVGDITIDWADPNAHHPYDIVAYPEDHLQITITINNDGVVFSETGTNEKTITLPGDDDPLPVFIRGDELLVDVDEDVSGSIRANIRVYYYANGQYLIDESYGDEVDEVDDEDIVVKTDRDETVKESLPTTAIYLIGALTLTINGEVQKAVNPSYIKDGRTYLAIRDIATGLGIDPTNVKWDEANQMVKLTKGTKVVSVQIGSYILNLNGDQSVMDVAPEINNARTMLPAAYIANVFGATASWDANNNSVTIK